MRQGEVARNRQDAVGHWMRRDETRCGRMGSDQDENATEMRRTGCDQDRDMWDATKTETRRM